MKEPLTLLTLLSVMDTLQLVGGFEAGMAGPLVKCPFITRVYMDFQGEKEWGDLIGGEN